MVGKRKLLLLLPLAVVAGVLGYKYWQNRSKDDLGVIPVSGNIEVTDAEVSFRIAGHVEERLLSEGDTVERGQVVATLDRRELEREVALRQAEVKGASAALDELLAGSRPEEIAAAEAAVQQVQAGLDELLAGSRPQEVKAAMASLDRAKTEAELQRSEYERQKRLYEKEVISKKEYEAFVAAHKAAEARLKEANEHLELVREGPRKEQIEQARAAVAQARERYELVRKGPRQETIEQARARFEQADAALALAQTRLGYTTLASPLSGVVLSDNVEAGEYVSPGTPVLTVGDLDNVWLRAYINENDLGRVKVGQPVRVTTDTYPGKVYEGRVSFIASEAEFTPRNVQTQKQRVKLVYRVKIDIPNPETELKPGMPADAEIVVGERAE